MKTCLTVDACAIVRQVARHNFAHRKFERGRPLTQRNHCVKSVPNAILLNSHIPPRGADRISFQIRELRQNRAAARHVERRGLLQQDEPQRTERSGTDPGRKHHDTCRGPEPGKTGPDLPGDHAPHAHHKDPAPGAHMKAQARLWSLTAEAIGERLARSPRAHCNKRRPATSLPAVRRRRGSQLAPHDPWRNKR